MGDPFRLEVVSREKRYALETDTRDGRRYLAIPVSNRLADYVERYRLEEAEFQALMADPGAAQAFAARCGAREMDDRLLSPPGSDRGVW
jgi:hypothetical protein